MKEVLKQICTSIYENAFIWLCEHVISYLCRQIHLGSHLLLWMEKKLMIVTSLMKVSTILPVCLKTAILQPCSTCCLQTVWHWHMLPVTHKFIIPFTSSVKITGQSSGVKETGRNKTDPFRFSLNVSVHAVNCNTFTWKCFSHVPNECRYSQAQLYKHLCVSAFQYIHPSVCTKWLVYHVWSCDL